MRNELLERNNFQKTCAFEKALKKIIFFVCENYFKNKSFGENYFSPFRDAIHGHFSHLV